MIYDVIRYPDPRLETPCDPITEFDTPELDKLVADMFETMYYHGGVGLAAPQVGVMKQLAVIDVSVGQDEAQKIVVINPTITKKEGKQRGDEGCLCFPGFREDVTRFQTVVVSAKNAKGETYEMECSDILARAAQHEIDHLSGILFIRHVSVLKRDLIRRKIRKLIKAGEWGTISPGPREGSVVSA
jgi:peptide deformylase